MLIDRIFSYLKNNVFLGDKSVWMIYFFLCMVSLVTIYSAGSNLTFNSHDHWAPVLNQAGFLAVGFVIILMVTHVPARFFVKAIPLIGIPLVLIMLGYVFFKERAVNDASRWMSLFGVSFQPSEIAKTCLILYVALILHRHQNKEEKKTGQGRKFILTATKGGHSRAFWNITIVTGLVCLLIAPENFSTAMMLFTVIAVMMVIGNIPLDLLFKSSLVIALLAIVGVIVVVSLPDEKLAGAKRALTWKHRIQSRFGSSEADADSTLTLQPKQIRVTDEERQVTMAKIAIANSNVIGLGVGNSIERDFLPHAESDFIYSIIVEETGAFGAIFVLALYVILFVRVGKIAKRSHNFFYAFTLVGLVGMMVLQALVNMAVSVGLAPVTGQTLPLISHGGTSIIICSFNIGLILSISYSIENYQKKKLAAEAAKANANNAGAVQSV